MARGGARKGAGRTPMTDEQRFNRAREREQLVVDELLLPALVSAMKSDPGPNQKQYLQIQISKKHIQMAYGDEGLKEWMSYFTMEKVGHTDRNGHYQTTRWSMNMSKYGVFVKMLALVGHTPKDLPDVWFPPDAMMARVNVKLAASEARRLKKANKMWDEIEQAATVAPEQQELEEAMA